MLTKYDEFPCHQIVSTFDSVETSAREWTERLWFCAHDLTGEVMLVAGFGFYSNRNIMDAFVCLATEGKTQYNVRASRELRPRKPGRFFHGAVVLPRAWQATFALIIADERLLATDGHVAA